MPSADLPPTQKINPTSSSQAGKGRQFGATGTFVRMPPSAPPEGVSACSAFSSTILQKSDSHEVRPLTNVPHIHIFIKPNMRPRRGLGMRMDSSCKMSSGAGGVSRP